MFNQALDIADVNNLGKDTIVAHLGIEFTEIGPDYLVAKMPVDSRTVQPFRLLHGGASAVLAESLGSMASALCIELGKQNCVGLEINANHLRPVRDGYVYGTARPLHLGQRTHVWEIRIADDQDKLVCVSRLTVMIVNHD